MPRACRLAALTAVLVMAVAAPASATDCPGSDLSPGPDNVAAVSAATLCLINNERTSRGMPALREQAQLSRASLDFSLLMVREQFFAHVSPGGSTLQQRLTASGYLGRPGGWIVGENIAWGESYLARPGSIVLAWMKSPGHRENILSDRYTEIGIGIALATPLTENPGATYTTDFGQREYGDGEKAPASAPVTGELQSKPVVSTPEAPRADAKPVAVRRAATRRTSTRKRTRRVTCRVVFAGFANARATAKRTSAKRCVVAARRAKRR